MARALLIVRRRRESRGRLEVYLDALNRNLAPDNIVPRAPSFACKDGAEAAIFNPNGATQLEGTSIRIGALLEHAPRWHEPGAPLPEGSYALLRTSADRVELAADAVASRTIWYVLTEDELIASTSQRAIITLLRDFKINRDALPWMLSSGTLGPERGWDVRLKRVRGGERLLLDRARWRLTRSGGPAAFNAAAAGDEAAFGAELSELVAAACRRLTVDPARWALPLSGGVDSRALLFHLRHRRGLETITWGRRDARHQEGNDAQIARALAATLGVANRYFPTDLSNEPRERLMQRFLTAGEGRVAEISGYLDGFAVWKTLFESGVEGIVRGDEAFGLSFVHSAAAARRRARFTLLTDFFTPHEIASFGVPEQRVPAELARGAHETLSTWRDRLYQQFRIPLGLAGLTDLKAAYVEVANPLLTRSVLDFVRRMPDGLRTEKRLWREIVRAQLPEVPFADQPAVVQIEHFLTDPAVLTLMRDEMQSSGASDLFARPLRSKVCVAIEAALRASPAPAHAKSRFALPLKRMIPEGIRAATRSWRAATADLNPLVFAFRSFLAARMNTLLQVDAATPPANLRRAMHL